MKTNSTMILGARAIRCHKSPVLTSKDHACLLSSLKCSVSSRLAEVLFLYPGGNGNSVQARKAPQSRFVAAFVSLGDLTAAMMAVITPEKQQVRPSSSRFSSGTLYSFCVMTLSTRLGNNDSLARDNSCYSSHA